MSAAERAAQLVWVTRTVALNPTQILEVFRGKGGHMEVHMPGRSHQFSEHDLTEAGRALLLPPDDQSPSRDGASPIGHP